MCFSPDTLVSATNNTDRHDIPEVLLKVGLRFIITFANGVFDLKFGKRKSTNISNEWKCNHGQMSHDFFYGICNVCFICYTVGLSQYSKSAWSKVGTHNVYIKLHLNAIKLYQKWKGCQRRVWRHKNVPKG